MQRLFGILLLSYFISGTLLLPQGDFASLTDMPRMYAHCRATEDPDMDIPDFITEHLFVISDLMGGQPEPEDKPHQPVEFHHIYTPVVIELRQSLVKIEPAIIHKITAPLTDDIYLSDYPASVFRPPII